VEAFSIERRLKPEMRRSKIDPGRFAAFPSFLANLAGAFLVATYGKASKAISPWDDGDFGNGKGFGTTIALVGLGFAMLSTLLTSDHAPTPWRLSTRICAVNVSPTCSRTNRYGKTIAGISSGVRNVCRLPPQPMSCTSYRVDDSPFGDIVGAQASLKVHDDAIDFMIVVESTFKLQGEELLFGVQTGVEASIS